MKKFLYTIFSVAASISFVNAQNDPGLTVGDTGTVTFSYRGNTVSYITVRAADNKIWLQQNIGSTTRAVSATDTAAYGHLFQWGRWDDGHQLRNSSTASPSTLSANDPSGLGTGSAFFYNGNNPNDWWSAGSGTDTWSDAPASATNGIDPCSAIGPGWHMPSQPEWANLITLENITNVATGFTSNLKLPAPGMREGNLAGLLNVGLYGNYWASTPSAIYAKNITILDNGVNNSDDALRSYGFSVRCIANCTGVFPPQSINGSDTVCSKSVQTFNIAAVNNANDYIWSVPSGWTITGSPNGTSISVITGSNSGSISVMARNTCDTSEAATFMVTVRPEPNPVITAAGNLLSTGSFAQYQWLFNEVPIPGAQSSSYTATNSGDYRVRVADAEGCIDTSAIFSHTLVGIDNIALDKDALLYPNPAHSMLYIKMPEKADVTIYSVEGKLIAQHRNTLQVDISDLPVGIYQVRLQDRKGRLVKVEKLIVIRE